MQRNGIAASQIHGIAAYRRSFQLGQLDAGAACILDGNFILADGGLCRFLVNIHAAVIARNFIAADGNRKRRGFIPL